MVLRLMPNAHFAKSQILPFLQNEKIKIFLSFFGTQFFYQIFYKKSEFFIDVSLGVTT
jgi:RAB protein geranylgeranyltransferase component A